jgi:hypothetical protein
MERKRLGNELDIEGKKRLNDKTHDEDVEDFEDNRVTYSITKGLF